MLPLILFLGTKLVSFCLLKRKVFLFNILLCDSSRSPGGAARHPAGGGRRGPVPHRPRHSRLRRQAGQLQLLAPCVLIRRGTVRQVPRGRDTGGQGPTCGHQVRLS